MPLPSSYARTSKPGLFAGALAICLSGCTMFDRPVAEAPQGSAFSWLANWVNQPLDSAPRFDVESLRPDPKPLHVVSGDLLEVTVWDLYEPGQPYTFPVRVSEKRTIEVPFLSEFSVAERSIPDVESGLIHGYRAGEFLVNPRILVRSLDPPTVKVQASGAVVRPGYVELPRADTTVYAALMSAGGLRKTAGSQIAVVRRAARQDPTLAPAITAESSDRGIGRTIEPTTPPENHANSLEERSVEPGQKLADSGSAPDAFRAGPPARSESEVAAPRWYNLGRDEDRETLRTMLLVEGDEVIVKAAAAPIRVGGIVRQPGAFPLPAGRALDVWQAIEMAGGIAVVDTPVNITLIRPASEGRTARRWSLGVEHYDKHPATSPLLEPGDVLHVEPTTGSRIKRAVGDLWNKP